jgi:hypothetical protein
MVFLTVDVAAWSVCSLHMVKWKDGRIAEVLERISKEEALALLRYSS